MSTRSRISVAMAVYNGQRFIAEQLDSFVHQTRLPDELVINDNASSDHTVDIIQEFASRAPFPVRLHVNAENIGLTRNFERALELCTGDIVFLSDCDDVWREEKLECFETVFREHPEVGLVISDSEVVNADLTPTGKTIWQMYGFRTNGNKLIIDSDRHCPLRLIYRFWGHGMAFRFDNEYRSLILPFPDALPHDTYLGLVLADSAPLCLMNRSMVKYRRHSENVSSGPFISGVVWRIGAARSRQRSELERLILSVRTIRERLLQLKSSFWRPRVSWFAEYERFLCMQASLPNWKLKRMPLICQELIAGRYHRFANGFRSAAKDLLFTQFL
jgi:glycosyltransferase involved in cell wall biosynthesis